MNNLNKINLKVDNNKTELCVITYNFLNVYISMTVFRLVCVLNVIIFSTH